MLSGQDHAEVDRWLADTFRASLGVKASEPTRRIYVSRRGAERRVTNEDEVEAMLAKHGFETFISERASLREHAEVLGQAKAVVATHGAGLTNLLFVPAGATVVEMIPRHLMHNSFVYWSMANAMGHVLVFRRRLRRTRWLPARHAHPRRQAAGNARSRAVARQTGLRYDLPVMSTRRILVVGT